MHKIVLLEPGAKVQWMLHGEGKQHPADVLTFMHFERRIHVFFFFLDTSHAWINARDETIPCGAVWGGVWHSGFCKGTSDESQSDTKK